MTPLKEAVRLWTSVKVAPSRDSGTGVGLPLAIITQNGVSLVGALEDPHPVWKPRGAPVVVPVML